ncbi:MAG: hypothetical protein EHM20_07390 [Alphaproteobacteria bacterium]|nr:MAG: hypothetical protein EHM20_07390 [Alphaproteobacteria bacterium]
MIISDKRTAWGISAASIKCISLWSPEFEEKGAMRFYDGDTQYVVDVTYGKDLNQISVVTCPFNNPDIISIATTKEEDIRNLLSSLTKNALGYVTIDIEKEPKVVTLEDFSRYAPTAELKDELFIFSTKNKEAAFPRIFCIEKAQRIHNPDVLRAFTKSSLHVMDCASLPTDLGKEFTYTLLISTHFREFNDELPASIVNLRFPTRGNCNLPSHLNMENFDKFCDEFDDQLKVSEKGIEEKPEETAIEVFGKLPQKELLKAMQKQILERDSLSLSDVFQVGFTSVLQNLLIKDSIIDLEPDVPGIIKRGCIKEGTVFVVPLSFETFDPEESFGEPWEMFQICTEENFPRKYSNSIIKEAQ